MMGRFFEFAGIWCGVCCSVHMDIYDGTIFLNLQVSGVEYAVATHAMLSSVYHVFVNRNVTTHLRLRSFAFGSLLC